MTRIWMMMRWGYLLGYKFQDFGLSVGALEGLGSGGLGAKLGFGRRVVGNMDQGFFLPHLRRLFLFCGICIRSPSLTLKIRYQKTGLKIL